MRDDASLRGAGYRTDRRGRVRWIASASVELAPEIKGLVPKVRPRPPRYWDPVEAWYQAQRAHDGVSVVMGGEQTPFKGQHHRRVPHWFWPPLPWHPSYGWRGRLIATWIIAWRDRRPRSRFFRKWTWAALHAIAKGQRPFSWKVWKDVLAQVAWKQAYNAAKREAWLARHPERRRGRSRPRYQVNLVALMRGESSRITPWAPPIVMPQRDPPKPKRAPSQWNEE